MAPLSTIMETIPIILLILVQSFNIVELTTILEYETERNIFLNEELRHRMGTGLLANFTLKETQVNDIVKMFRTHEMEQGMTDLKHYPPQNHFFKAKESIERDSILFKIIRSMPKGALLHGHNLAMVSSEWFLNNITYRKGLKLCMNRNIPIFTFRTKHGNCTSQLLSVSNLRKRTYNVTHFDQNLRTAFDLYTTTPELDYPDINTVWRKFSAMFMTTRDVIYYLPIFRDYHYRMLEELYEDKVYYAEIRGDFPYLYDSEERIYNTTGSLKILYDVIEKFKANHPNFWGCKVIYAAGRKYPPKAIEGRINIAKDLISTFPNFVVGFDLVGQEDNGEPLATFLDQLNNLPPNMKLFLHAGETNLNGVTDLNLLDAILLRTQRIGHAFGLYKHPYLWDFIKKYDIGLEINPISNQVLELVKDLRNHPAAVYIAENLPIVISSDDPGFWNAKGLSYDFFYAFMAFAPHDAGLEILKQLVLNSIKYSAMNEIEKSKSLESFNGHWDIFLDGVFSGNL